MQYMKSLEPPTAETRKSTQQCICLNTHDAAFILVQFYPPPGCLWRHPVLFVHEGACGLGAWAGMHESEWMLCSLTSPRFAVLCGDTSVWEVAVWREAHQWTNTPVSFNMHHFMFKGLCGLVQLSTQWTVDPLALELYMSCGLEPGHSGACMQYCCVPTYIHSFSVCIPNECRTCLKLLVVFEMTCTYVAWALRWKGGSVISVTAAQAPVC